jgi:hypothetical protein
MEEVQDDFCVSGYNISLPDLIEAIRNQKYYEEREIEKINKSFSLNLKYE